MKNHLGRPKILYISFLNSFGSRTYHIITVPLYFVKYEIRKNSLKKYSPRTSNFMEYYIYNCQVRLSSRTYECVKALVHGVAPIAICRFDQLQFVDSINCNHMSLMPWACG